MTGSKEQISGRTDENLVSAPQIFTKVRQKDGIKVYVFNILHAKCTTLNFRETDCDIARITNRQTRYLMFGNTASHRSSVIHASNDL